MAALAMGACTSARDGLVDLRTGNRLSVPRAAIGAIFASVGRTKFRPCCEIKSRGTDAELSSVHAYRCRLMVLFLRRTGYFPSLALLLGAR